MGTSKGKSGGGVAKVGGRGKETPPPPPDSPEEALELGEALFAHAIGSLQYCQQLIRSIENSEIGADLSTAHLNMTLDGVVHTLRHCKPFRVCPMGRQCDVTCKACRGRRWVSKAVWDHIPEGFRK